MQSLNEWFSALWDLLLDGEEELCFSLIVGTRSQAKTAIVELVEGSLNVEDAVNYARVLIELGREFCAEEVLRAAAFGGLSSQQVASAYAGPPMVRGNVVATA